MTSFIDFASQLGLIINHVDQCRWVRVPTVDHPHKRNGAYYFGGDYAHIQNWATMDEACTWFSNKPTCPIEYEAMKKKMEAAQLACRIERIKLQQRAAEKAKLILSQCFLDKHPYMIRKGFPDTMVNVYYKGNVPTMVIPMFADKKLCGIQTIDEGVKKFLFGSRTHEAYHHIGNGKQIYLCEGYVSALSLHKVLCTLNKPATVLATFSAGNMAKMARKIPDCFLVGDNDKSLTSEKVCKESGRKYWIPPVEGFDINDLLIYRGLFQTSQLLRQAINSV